LQTELVKKYKIGFPGDYLKSPYMLGIAEKPTAAKRIASTLGVKSEKITVPVIRLINNKKTELPSIDIYRIEVENQSMAIFIIPALGHLFTLVQDGLGWQYPVYDFKWEANHLTRRRNKEETKFDQRIEATIEVLRKVIKKSKKNIVMTDYDEEGEVIGGIIISQLVGDKELSKACRMKFSSFSKKELQSSFSEALSNGGINKGMYQRGLMRHYLDWLWGINLSRALMLSLKNTSGQYSTLSTGRVQGPTLSFISLRQKEIESFVPIPFFKLFVSLDIDGITPIEYDRGVIKSQKEAIKVVTKIKGEEAEVKEIKSRSRKDAPPPPFNLSSLQNDAYRYHRINPSRTLQAAENLYLDAAISYPRTSSERYPDGINHQDIISKLSKNPGFAKITKKILAKKKLNPIVGKKQDPAHPCIYPTGGKPRNLKGDNEKIYALIVHRYLSTFGEDAEVQINRINFEIKQEKFHITGRRTLKKGWRELAGTYGQSEDKELPNLEVDMKFKVDSASQETTYSRPPPYYNQSSLLKKMEEQGIGTKATRSEIIKSLFDRKFLDGNQIEITPVGDIINEVLTKYSPQVLSVELSRNLEKMGDLIEETINEEKSEEEAFTLSDALVQGVSYLHNMLGDIQSNESQVGSLISTQLTIQRKNETEISKCISCKDGMLKIIHNSATGKRFVGCTEYFNNQNCTITFPLPQRGKIIKTDGICKIDSYPVITIITGRKPWSLCLHPTCPSNEMLKKSDKKSKTTEESEVKTSVAKPTSESKSSTKTTRSIPKKTTKKTTKKKTEKTTTKPTKKTTRRKSN